MTLPLVLTQGDPAGIGPELALKAWLAREEAGLRPFILAAPEALMREAAAALGLDVPMAVVEPEEACATFPHALALLTGAAPARWSPGRPMPGSAAATIASIEAGVKLVHAGRAGALITNPIAKSVLYEAGFAHPGHTEFLGELARRLWREPCQPVMMIWSPELAVVPVTVHIPLHEVAASLTTALIIATGMTLVEAMRTRFGLAEPRIAVAGLNPHAGENGALGREDEEIVRPAVDALIARGISASGPLPADTLFHARARARYDVALCMYHDQALIPVKALAFDEGVNVTLGLPFVRTSPDHGTAFDIAGQGIARPDSLIAALRLAGRLAGGETAAA